MTTSEIDSAAEPRRATFDSADAAAVAGFLDAAYGNSLRIEAAPGRLTFRRTDLGPLSVDHLALSGRVGFSTDPISRFTVMECHTGSGRYDRGGLSDELAPGRVVATAAPGDSYQGHCGPLQIRLLNLDLDALREAAIEAQGSQSPLRFSGLAATTRNDALRWGCLIDFLELTADRGRAGGLAEHELARLVARTALEVFPNSTWEEPSAAAVARDGRDASAVAVRRACAYIESMADQDLALSDIAAAAHLSPRALQAAFRRHRGTTPMRHLQDVRMDAARRDLLDADERTSVAGVASQWGFFNHGRFAALYRAAFGELPSRTLGRALDAADPSAGDQVPEHVHAVRDAGVDEDGPCRTVHIDGDGEG